MAKEKNKIFVADVLRALCDFPQTPKSFKEAGRVFCEEYDLLQNAIGTDMTVCINTRGLNI